MPTMLGVPAHRHRAPLARHAPPTAPPPERTPMAPAPWRNSTAATRRRGPARRPVRTLALDCQRALASAVCPRWPAQARLCPGGGAARPPNSWVLIRAHPELAARPWGNSLTADHQRAIQAPGLTQCTPEPSSSGCSSSTAYNASVWFPFILACAAHGHGPDQSRDHRRI